MKYRLAVYENKLYCSTKFKMCKKRLDAFISKKILQYSSDEISRVGIFYTVY